MSETATIEQEAIEFARPAEAECKGAVATVGPNTQMPAPPEPQGGGFMAMIEKAVDRGDMTLVEKMMELQQRWEENEAHKAFNNALAAAKAKIKPITKNRTVGYEAKNEGSRDVSYQHEDLAGIASEIDEILGNEGLFYRWIPSNDFANGMVTVTCRVSHRLGHSEDFTLSAKVDQGAGKNHLQAVGSAVTYLERYTLKSALGLASKHDDDGRAAGAVVDEVDQTPLSAAQVEELQTLMVERAVPIAPFLGWVRRKAPKVEKINDIPGAYFASCISAIKKTYPEK